MGSEMMLENGVRPAIKALRPGESVRFAVRLVSQVRNACYTLGLEQDMVYKSHIKRKDNAVSVMCVGRRKK